MGVEARDDLDLNVVGSAKRRPMVAGNAALAAQLCLEATRESNTPQNGDRLGRLLVAPQFEQALCGNEESWEVPVNGRLNNGVLGVEVPMGEMVAHGSDVTPGDGRLTGATLDRLTHRCKIIETKGESYRLQDASKRARAKKS